MCGVLTVAQVKEWDSITPATVATDQMELSSRSAFLDPGLEMCNHLVDLMNISRGLLQAIQAIAVTFFYLLHITILVNRTASLQLDNTRRLRRVGNHFCWSPSPDTK